MAWDCLVFTVWRKRRHVDMTMNFALIKRLNKKKMSSHVYWWKYFRAVMGQCETGYCRSFIILKVYHFLIIVSWFHHVIFKTPFFIMLTKQTTRKIIFSYEWHIFRVQCSKIKNETIIRSSLRLSVFQSHFTHKLWYMERSNWGKWKGLLTHIFTAY